MCEFNLTKYTCSNSMLVAKQNGAPQRKKKVKKWPKYAGNHILRLDGFVKY